MTNKRKSTTHTICIHNHVMMASHHKFRAFQSDLLIVKISHEGCFGPYLTILSQLTFDVCVASKNCEKNYYNLLF